MLFRSGQLAQTDPVRKRVRMMKAYLHYLRLFREYGQAPKVERVDALGRAMRYGFRIEPLHAVAIKNVFYRIVGKPRARKIKAPEATLAQWMRASAITDEEIDADFARDLADLKPLGDMMATMAALACGHPQVHFVFEHSRDGAVVCRWDSESAKPART